MRLKGKVAIATGGNSGIGKGIALMFAKEGVNEYINKTIESFGKINIMVNNAAVIH